MHRRSGELPSKQRRRPAGTGRRLEKPQASDGFSDTAKNVGEQTAEIIVRPEPFVFGLVDVLVLPAGAADRRSREFESVGEALAYAIELSRITGLPWRSEIEGARS